MTDRVLHLRGYYDKLCAQVPTLGNPLFLPAFMRIHGGPCNAYKSAAELCRFVTGWEDLRDEDVRGGMSLPIDQIALFHGNMQYLSDYGQINTHMVGLSCAVGWTPRKVGAHNPGKSREVGYFESIY